MSIERDLFLEVFISLGEKTAGEKGKWWCQRESGYSYPLFNTPHFQSLLQAACHMLPDRLFMNIPHG